MTSATTFPDGGSAQADLVAIYKVNENGRIASLRSFREFDRLGFKLA